MWRCANCSTEIEDKHFHCWNCGAKRSAQPARSPTPVRETALGKSEGQVERSAVPAFASFEEMAPGPEPGSWVFRRSLFTRVFFLLVAVVLVKIFSSQFLGTYGSYIMIGVAVIALIIILWRSFRRHPTEGVGIKLH